MYHLIEVVEVVCERHGLVRPQGLHGEDDGLVPRRRQLRHAPQPRLEDAVQERLLRLQEYLMECDPCDTFIDSFSSFNPEVPLTGH